MKENKYSIVPSICMQKGYSTISVFKDNKQLIQISLYEKFQDMNIEIYYNFNSILGLISSIKAIYFNTGEWDFYNEKLYNAVRTALNIGGDKNENN